jgi:hypothetical protein
MENIKEKAKKEAKRVEEDSLYSAKGHFVAARSWINVHYWIGVPTALLAGVAGATALAQFENHNIVAGVLSIIVAMLTSVTTFLNPNERATSHQNAGTAFNALRSDARLFYEIEADLINSEEALTKRLKELTDQRSKLNQSSPQIPKRAFEKGREGIEAGEAKYEVDTISKKNRKARSIGAPSNSTTKQISEGTASGKSSTTS